jgi:GntR family transcriptional regulator
MSENNRIDPYSCVPRYHQLFTILKQKIDDGEWKRNESIPSERSLELMYNVSRTTIRQTLDLLSDYGYIYREHGRGTFVAPAIMQNSVNELISFSDDMSSRGFQPGQRILKIQYIEPSGLVRQKLELDTTINTVLYIERVRLADGIPIGIQYAYVP